MGKTKIFILTSVALGLLILYLISKPYYLFFSQILKVSPLKTLLSLDSLKTYDGEINILVLGVAGQNYEGPNLSDSIIVANFNLKTNKLLTISLPRDIWSDTLKDKINTAYAYGEAKQKNGGLKLAKAEIEAVVGLPIQYAAVIDFEKFKELIDFLGGIDLYIDLSFVDKQFPIPGKENDECAGDAEYRCRYETISFTKGKAHMDGATALKFVRSRYAEGEEGSDFARNKRQQKVLEAVKNKILSLIKKFNLQDLARLYRVFDRLITRDITNQQITIVAKNALLSRNFSQKEITLAEDFFVVPEYSLYKGQYVLIPESGNFDLVHRYIQCYKNNFLSNTSNFAGCEKLKKK